VKGQTANANANAIGQDAIDGCVLVGNGNITFPDSRNVPTFLTFGGRQSAIGICDSIAASHLGPFSTSMSRIPSRKSTPQPCSIPRSIRTYAFPIPTQTDFTEKTFHE